MENTSIIDPFLSIVFLACAYIYAFFQGDYSSPRSITVLVLETVWALRLAIYLGYRNWGAEEDFRYKEFRSNGGPLWWLKSLAIVFILQGFLGWIISVPLLAVFQLGNNPRHALTAPDYVGLGFWVVGFLCEVVGDSQLAAFKANPENRGKTLNYGIWRYTRHPNYFGETLMIWGIYFFAAAAGGWWSFFAPLIMTILLVKVSGVTMLENSLVDRRPGYREYMETTSAFIPWFPAKPKAASLSAQPSTVASSSLDRANQSIDKRQ
eukprot:Platyproteum_vivax@DN6229_c0_g1_i4.p1